MMEQSKQSEQPASESTSQNWERDIINRLAFASLNEQRRSRRWGIFFKILAFGYLFLLLFFLFSGEWGELESAVGKHTALVEVQGVIDENAQASADSIITALRAAFGSENTAAVIMRINSPGGSPVQAGYVYDEIRRLRQQHPDIPLYAVISDMGASGGYYIAAAADKIYADKASIVGSIGVTMSPFSMSSFGFTEAMKKLGIQRRLLTSGESKSLLDPFSPLKPKDTEHIKKLLDNIHTQFINAVRTGRGDRLQDDPAIFSGLIWTGEEGVALGLVDALGSTSFVAREVIGVEEIVDYTLRPNYLDRFAERLGVALGKGIFSVVNLPH
ncbi:MAG TPA: S49 family peptidase [Gammaproteobacteria bacterium]|nr:S49 family peptidase [Gammaproteobacteria bacterium]